MKRILKSIGAWFRKVFHVIKRMEELNDYRYENYAQDRFDRLEQRLAVLEDQLRK
jgi:hypothetical protein